MPKPALTYLTRRGSVYWFRMAVPIDLAERFGCRKIKGSATNSFSRHRAATVPTPRQRDFAVDCTGPQHA